jgi:hypothetical protein
MTLIGMAAMGLGLFAPAFFLPRLHADGPSLIEHVVAAIVRGTEADRVTPRGQSSLLTHIHFPPIPVPHLGLDP